MLSGTFAANAPGLSHFRADHTDDNLATVIRVKNEGAASVVGEGDVISQERKDITGNASHHYVDSSCSLTRSQLSKQFITFQDTLSVHHLHAESQPRTDLLHGVCKYGVLLSDNEHFVSGIDMAGQK